MGQLRTTNHNHKRAIRRAVQAVERTMHDAPPVAVAVKHPAKDKS